VQPVALTSDFDSFKPRGGARTETNEPDRFEWLNVGQDGLLGNAPLQPLPELVHTHLPVFTSFLKHGQSIVSTINTTLATQLGVAPDTFTSLQSPKQASGTVVRLIKAYASPEQEDLRTSMVHHTDFGTITLLANVLGGLQILAPGKAPTDEGAWLYVRPKPGCLIVNLGDAMVQWTGGLLRSNCHRINFAPGDQRFVDRYSLGLLVRPHRDASMRPLMGKAIQPNDKNLTAWEWEIEKAMALTRGDAVMQSKGGKPAAVA
jgi:isopenicillin N synthase-like dioxygenase